MQAHPLASPPPPPPCVRASKDGYFSCAYYAYYYRGFEDDVKNNLCYNSGIMQITSLTFVRSSQTLVCISTGGPATSVSWTEDGDPLTVDEIPYQHSQIITDTSSATYENRLRIVSISDAVSGVYSCLVMNSRDKLQPLHKLKVSINFKSNTFIAILCIRFGYPLNSLLWYYEASILQARLNGHPDTLFLFFVG